mgnify:CR=1 FL=1
MLVPRINLRRAEINSIPAVPLTLRVCAACSGFNAAIRRNSTVRRLSFPQLQGDEPDKPAPSFTKRRLSAARCYQDIPINAFILKYIKIIVDAAAYIYF